MGVDNMRNKKTKIYIETIKLFATKLTKKQLKMIARFLEIAYLDGRLSK